MRTIPKQHVLGVRADRLKPERDNPREVAFMEQWSRENENFTRPHTMRTLDELLYGHGHGIATRCAADCAEIPVLSTDDPQRIERDRIVAATLVQWLGSNVGFSFIEESLRLCGYEIVRKGANR